MSFRFRIQVLEATEITGEEEKEEVENMEREIVVAKFEIPYTSFNDGKR